MARWKELPGELDPVVVEFVGQLRQLKDNSGLSLNRLATRTGYSVSSWERYLNARLLPPPAAVEALAGVAGVSGVDGARLSALRGAAGDRWGRGRGEGRAGGGRTGEGFGAEGRADGEEAGALAAPLADREGAGALAAPLAVALTASPPSSPAAAPSDNTSSDTRPVAPSNAPAESGASAPHGLELPSARGPVTRRRLYLTAAAAALTGAAIATAVTAAIDSGTADDSPHATTVAQPIDYACQFVRKAGAWYAGESATSTDLLEVDMSGPEVAELQCLLQHAGISPGGVDGNFGPLTESAVIAAQKRYHLDVDGQVGPHTWAALRG
ncbi:peptidoglycan-binding protein [Streptomyces sp. NPDC004539]|uniref:peptidoglycan-binding protein n=1 Tax=Streptomyces sp. NPDC004539 TaxID=3154280 RepID=UPI0033B2AEDD